METASWNATQEATPACGAAETWLDFDLHGLVGIRLIDASPADRSAVSAQLGPLEGRLGREPDVIIRFVERLPISGPVRLLGLRDAGYTEDAFVVLRGKHKLPLRVQIPFDRIGSRCEIVCERGVPAVPLLIAIVNLTALARGGLAMHASAFRYAGSDVLVTGWSKGGKTELLLGFAAHGAQYIGDEWIYVSDDRQRVFGIPEPVRVWDWQLQQLPQYWHGLRPRKRLQLKALRFVAASLACVVDRADAPDGGWQRYAGRFAALLERQRYTHIEPQRAFGTHSGPLHGSVQTVLFVASHDAPETAVERIAPEQVADRMIFSFEEERAGLMAYYRMFRFAFPEKVNPLLETASDIERERLRRFLKDRACYAVYHPYPPSISDLVDAVRPVIEG